MDDIVLEPTTRARVKDIPAKRKATTDPLGTTVQIEAGLPDAPLSPDGLTSRQVLHRTRERLRAQAAANPADTGSWWTALPSGHLHVFAFENGRVLDDFVVENDPIGIKHGMLKTALMRTLGVRDEGEGPFNARMKTFLQLGLFGPVGIQRERRNYGYSLTSALKWAVAMTLQRAYVPPSAVVDFLNRHDRDLQWMFRRLRTGDGPPLVLRVNIEALQPLGNEPRSKGRGSRGGETGTLSLGEANRTLFDIAAAAPALEIDLRELGNKLMVNLADAGVSVSKILNAQSILPDLSARPTPPPAPPSPPESSGAGPT